MDIDATSLYNNTPLVALAPDGELEALGNALIGSKIVNTFNDGDEHDPYEFAVEGVVDGFIDGRRSRYHVTYDDGDEGSYT